MTFDFSTADNSGPTPHVRIYEKESDTTIAIVYIYNGNVNEAELFAETIIATLHFAEGERK